MALKKHWFHILLALTEGPAHGAEIRRRVKRHTQGALKLYPAMLYGSLDDLCDQGWIQETEAESDPAGSRGDRARPFALTADGREILEEETREQEGILRIARGLLEGGGAR